MQKNRTWIFTMDFYNFKTAIITTYKEPCINFHIVGIQRNFCMNIGHQNNLQNVKIMMNFVKIGILNAYKNNIFNCYYIHL